MVLHSSPAVTITASSNLGAATMRSPESNMTPSTTYTALSTATKSPSTSTSVFSTTTSTTLADCPSANNSAYTSTNKPISNVTGNQFVVAYTSLTYQILCDITLNPSDNEVALLDMQVLLNTSFKDCLDACSLYTFQTPVQAFPEFGCTGVTWRPDYFCWLKKNTTFAKSIEFEGYNSAVLMLEI